MTRKDYILIAHVIALENCSIDPAVLHAVRRVAFGLADALASDNPNFDRWKFLTACGVAE